MSDRETALMWLALGLFAAVVIMASMHERHYKRRRSPLLEARLRSIDARLEVLEGIVGEDRLL